MKRIGTMLALCLLGTAAAVSCSDDGDDNETTTSSSSTTTTSSSSTSSSSTSGAGGCDINPIQTLGTDQVCADCLAGECCESATAYEADPNETTYLNLFKCADRGSRTDDTFGCLPECVFPACNQTLTLLLVKDCAECVEQNCCTQWAACESNLECAQCTTAFNFEASCCDNPLVVAMSACWNDVCATECQPLSPAIGECTGGTGGGGGSGGAGGSGGSGGSGGTGGS